MSQELIVVCPLFTVKLTGEDERDLIQQAAFWLSLPTKCPVCGSTLGLDYRTPKTFEYYTLKCNGSPAHSVNLGEKQLTHKLYYDAKKTWEIFRPGQSEEVGTGTPNAALPPAESKPEQSNLSGLRNSVIKLISNAKVKGIRTGLTPADVGGLSEEQLNGEFNRLLELLTGKEQEQNARSEPERTF